MGGKKAKKGGRTTPKGTRPPAGRGPREEVDDPFVEVRAALREPGPGGLLAFASMVVETATPPVWSSAAPELDLDVFAQVLEHDDRREATALLAALVVLTPDGEPRERMRAALADRSFDRLPSWVDGIGAATATATWSMRHVFDDDEQAIIGLRWPGGEDATVSVLLRRNQGLAAMDGVIYPVPVDAVIDHVRVGFGAEPGAQIEPADPARLRAVVTEAVERGAEVVPGYETDTWPETRPLVRWACSLLPPGAEVTGPAAIDDGALDGIVAEVMASPEAGALAPHPAHPGIVRELVWYGAMEGGAADGLLWSPQRVELVLLDWIPRELDLPYDDALTVPTVLRVLVRYGSRVRDLDEELVAETLDAVDRYEPDYLDAVADIERLIAGVDDDDEDDEDDEWADGDGGDGAGIVADPSDAIAIAELARQLELGRPSGAAEGDG